jgi:hypothetical protein
MTCALTSAEQFNCATRECTSRVGLNPKTTTHTSVEGRTPDTPVSRPIASLRSFRWQPHCRAQQDQVRRRRLPGIHGYGEPFYLNAFRPGFSQFRKAIAIPCRGNDVCACVRSDIQGRLTECRCSSSNAERLPGNQCQIAVQAAPQISTWNRECRDLAMDQAGRECSGVDQPPRDHAIGRKHQVRQAHR